MRRIARCCCARVATGYLKLCDWLSRAYRSNQHRGRAELSKRVVRRGHRRPDRAVRRTRRRRRPGAAARQRERRAQARRAPGRGCSRIASTSRCSAPDGPTTTRSWRRPSASRASSALPVVATHPVQFLRARGLPRARGARVHRRRPHPRRHAPSADVHRRAVLHDAGGDGARFADLPEALANSVAIAQRCNLTIPLGKSSPAGVSDAAGRHDRRASATTRRARGSSSASKRCFPTPPSANGGAPSTSRASRSRPRPSCRWASPATS